jgi:hypothetical protein
MLLTPRRHFDVSDGSLADICAATAHVRFTPESGHQRTKLEHLLGAKNRQQFKSMIDGGSEHRRRGALDDPYRRDRADGIGSNIAQPWQAQGQQAFDHRH